MKLVDEKTGQEIKAGDKVTTFRGEKGTLVSWAPPRTINSSGKVTVKFGKHDIHGREFYPSVIGAKIVEE